MNFVPKSVSRFGYHSILKAKGASPTILVVAGVGGLVATAVLAAKATRHIDPILEKHHISRDEIGYVKGDREGQKRLLHLYIDTSTQLTKLYGPTIFVGTASAIAVLGGHKILRTRHMATVAAYSGLADQFREYRGRVAKTLGKEVEKGIYEGAHGEYKEDPEHKGEYKLQPVFDGTPESYLRPWFDETNVNWSRDPVGNYLFLKGVQQHMNNMLAVRKHVFLNDVRDALKLPRVPEGAVSGWLYNSEKGDGYIDFGFMASIDPNTIAFRNGETRDVQLNFNIDPGPIWAMI